MQMIIQTVVFISIFVLKKDISINIVSGKDSPDHITAAILNGISFNDFLNATIAAIKKAIPITLMPQSVIPFDLAKKKFQTDSHSADTIRSNNPTTFIYLSPFLNYCLTFFSLTQFSSAFFIKLALSLLHIAFTSLL